MEIPEQYDEDWMKDPNAEDGENLNEKFPHWNTVTVESVKHEKWEREKVNPFAMFKIIRKETILSKNIYSPRPFILTRTLSRIKKKR